jgi:hypothetical protein
MLRCVPDVSKIRDNPNLKILETDLHFVNTPKSSFFSNKNVYLPDISGFVAAIASTQFVE